MHHVDNASLNPDSVIFRLQRVYASDTWHSWSSPLRAECFVSGWVTSMSPTPTVSRSLPLSFSLPPFFGDAPLWRGVPEGRCVGFIQCSLLAPCFTVNFNHTIVQSSCFVSWPESQVALSCPEWKVIRRCGGCLLLQRGPLSFVSKHAALRNLESESSSAAGPNVKL